MLKLRTETRKVVDTADVALRRRFAHILYKKKERLDAIADIRRSWLLDVRFIMISSRGRIGRDMKETQPQETKLSRVGPDGRNFAPNVRRVSSDEKERKSIYVECPAPSTGSARFTHSPRPAAPVLGLAPDTSIDHELSAGSYTAA